MAENTKIEWTWTKTPDGTVVPGYTFNAWRGCAKVSPGCDNCYAEANGKRNPAVLGEWGPDAPRVIASEAYWRKPLKWNKEAELAGTRPRVFSLSLGDVFEDRPDLVAPRARLFNLFVRTPQLDWLLLTKRPVNITRLLPAGVPKLPFNVWMGTSIESDPYIDRGYALLGHAAEATIRFISAEPLLGPLTKLRELLMFGNRPAQCRCGHGHGFTRCPNTGGVAQTCHLCDCKHFRRVNGIHWVIVGGESDSSARPMDPAWARQIRDVCVECGVGFFFKQWGTWGPDSQFFHPLEGKDQCAATVPGLPNKIPLQMVGKTMMAKVGKGPAGNVLDGRRWDESPGGM